LALLTFSDLLCGLARNGEMLYAFRGLSGVANGGVASLSAMIVSDIVTLKDRPKWQGMIGAFVGLGQMVGPFIAAGFVQKSTWRGFFWLVSPLAACCGILCILSVPTPKKQPQREVKTVLKQIDWWGILTGSAALILILIPVAGGGDYFDWNSPMVVSMLCIGGCSLFAFIFVEYKVAELPMIPRMLSSQLPLRLQSSYESRWLIEPRTVSLFKKPCVAVMLAQNFLFGVVAFSQTFYLPLFFQNARRLSPLTSAALMLPLTGAQMVFSIASGQYISHFERYGEVIWLGFSLWTLGVGLTCMFDLDIPLYGIALILFIQGTGIGCVYQPVMQALQAHCSKSHRAVVISNRNFLRSLGGAVGLAISAAVLQNSLTSAMPRDLQHLKPSSYDTPDFVDLSPTQEREILGAYAKASRTVFIMNLPFMVVCLLLCFFIKDRGFQRPEEVQQEIEMGDRSDSRGSGSGESKRDSVRTLVDSPTDVEKNAQGREDGVVSPHLR
jgi:MFS family permease